jgi:hypothetical protein
MGAAAVAGQVPKRIVTDEHHVSPTATIATVGAALGNMRLAPEAQAAVAPGPGLNVDASSIVHTQTMADSVFLITGASSGTGVMFAVSQPPHVDVNEILVRPTAQDS